MTLVLLATDKYALLFTVLATFVLMFKMMVNATMTGHYRFKTGGRPPEDVKFKKGRHHDFHGTATLQAASPEKQAAIAKAQESLDRHLRILSNDHENVPLGLLMAWASVLTIGDRSWAATFHQVAVLAFLVGRVGHAFAYAYAIQPARSWCWFLGVVSGLALGVNAVIGAIELL